MAGAIFGTLALLVIAAAALFIVYLIILSKGFEH